MFNTLIVQPIFNLLALIYAIIPGHNFGLALVLFTIIVRLLLWPLVRKQLHQAKAMRKLQPDIKKIKAATKGNRQKEQVMMMELYKERGINPFATFPILIVQFIVLIGLYSGLRHVIADPHQLVNFTYPAIQHLPWLQQLKGNINLFDNTLFGVVNLSRSAFNPAGGVYFAGLIVVLGSVFAQYFQSKQLLPTTKDQRGLRAILKDAGKGKQADQSEVSAAVGKSTLFFLPVLVFFFTVNLPSALSLYWLVGGTVAIIQQGRVLGRDEEEMEEIADKPDRKSKKLADIPEAEVIVEARQKVAAKAAKTKKNTKSKAGSGGKRKKSA
ncbi:membrane protein insertase YidC [Candidatus Saccharibacteria bacterium]|nr:membrane protein insertase YidC [Candidatus Saccharibacteria bacterium]